MDGIDISEEGNIKYNNKRIDKLLIEGKDIFNNQHKLTLEAINPLIIKKIQVIKNYKAFHEKFFDRINNKIALNLLLTDEAKNKIQGDFNFGIGYLNKYKAMANMLMVGKKLAYSMFFRSNNKADAVISANDFLNMENSLSRAIIKANGNFDNLIPTRLIQKDDNQKSIDHLLAFNIEYSHSKKNTSKISFLSNFFNRDKASYIFQTYFADNSVLKGNKVNKYNSSFLYLVLNNKININTKTLLEIDIPLRYNDYGSNGKTNVNITYQTLNSKLLKKENKFTSFPHIYFSKKISNRYSFKIETAIDYNKYMESKKISSYTPLFDTDTSFAHQTRKINSLVYSIDGMFRFKKDPFRLNLTFATSRNSTKIETLDNLVSTDFFNPFFYIEQNYKFGLKLSYSTKKINVDIEGVAPYSRLSIDKALYKNSGINPVFGIKYSFSLLHFVVVRIKAGNKFYEPFIRYKNAIIVDANTLSINKVMDTEQKENYRDIYISYFRLKPRNGLKIYTLLKYGVSKNNLFAQYMQKKNYILKIVRVAQEGTMVMLKSTWAHKFFNKKLNLSLSFDWNHNKNIASKLFILDSKTYKINFSSNFKKIFNGTISYTYRFTWQMTDFEYINLVNHRFKLNIKTSYNKFKYYCNLAYVIRENNDVLSSFTILNMGLDFYPSRKYMVFISAKDIFNLQAKYVSNTNIFPEYYEQERYIRFPGSVLIGMKRSF